ncbi:MAG: transposase [Chloroflexi bacterium]|nr:transposase [Chloroflexota bacterium]
MATTIRTVCAPPDLINAKEQWRRVTEIFRSRFPRPAQLMDAAEAAVLAYLAFPPEHQSAQSTRKVVPVRPIDTLCKK